MALDIYSTVPMSDSPERVFSSTGHLLSPKRRTMAGEGVEQMTCLRAWEQSGIISLGQGRFSNAVAITPDEPKILLLDWDWRKSEIWELLGVQIWALLDFIDLRKKKQEPLFRDCEPTTNIIYYSLYQLHLHNEGNNLIQSANQKVLWLWSY